MTSRNKPPGDIFFLDMLKRFVIILALAAIMAFLLQIENLK